MTKELFDKEDDGVSLGHIHYALSQDPTPAPAPDAAEREHCERVSQELFLIPVPQRVEILLRERTAARQEGYNAHLEQLARHAQPTEDEREHCEHVCDEIVDALPINSETITDTQGCAVTDIIIRERSKLLAERDDFLRLFRESESERAAVRAEAAQAAASLRDAYEAKLKSERTAHGLTASQLADEMQKLTASNAELAGLRIQHERYRELQRDWVKQSEAELERLRARVQELEQDAEFGKWERGEL